MQETLHMDRSPMILWIKGKGQNGGRAEREMHSIDVFLHRIKQNHISPDHLH